jgi:uncharacterized membrane protein YtjA (UPF0391 family)
MLSHPGLLLAGALIAGWAGFGALASAAARTAKFLCVALLIVFAFLMFRGAGKQFQCNKT